MPEQALPVEPPESLSALIHEALASRPDVVGALGVLEHVPHVQKSRHIGRRQQHGELLSCVLRTIRRNGCANWRSDVKQLLPDPIFGPAFFNLGWIVCFRKFVAHQYF